MIFQPPGSPWCGPAALANAMRALGYKRKIEPLAELCGTTEDGTGPVGLMYAARELGFSVKEFSTDEDGYAKAWLRSTLAEGSAAILCVDSWTHWVAITGILGGRLLLQDSENGPRNQRENGSHFLSVRTVLRRWKAGASVAEGMRRYYGISIAIAR